MAKMAVKYSVVDAFAESTFKGNPAAVCLLEEERDEQWMQSVAAEFNLSETSFLIRITDSNPHPTFRLRWFTPVAEVELCGHATLAAAHTLFSSGLIDSDIIEFLTLSGILIAKRIPETVANESFFVELDFPVVPLSHFNAVDVSLISKALNGASVVDIQKSTSDNLFVVLPSAKSVVEMQPDFGAIEKCPGMGVIVTGVAPPESGFDFYSRYFCPKYGINEDPVTGSAHCSLAPYWCKELGKCDFVAYQASPRGGVIKIHLDEQKQRVLLQGKAFTVMQGTLLV